MKIEYIQNAPYILWSIGGVEGEVNGESLGGRGNIITSEDDVIAIGDIEIALSERSRDGQVVIDITRSGSLLIEGNGGTDGYVATIILPPKKYTYIASEELDEYGNVFFTKEELPINMCEIVLKLWSISEMETEE